MTDVTPSTDHEPSAAAGQAMPSVATPPRRRRLWQLPTQAHELLMALSFAPEWLRKEAARTLGQVHKGRCVLKGRDVDVLYSVVHDLTTRNPVAEAFQKHLDQRHALAVCRLAKLHDPEDLRAAWNACLDADDMPATLWALLTHPLGPELESTALYDARAWVFARARHGAAADLGQREAESRAGQAREQAEELRSRLLAQQRQAAQALSQAQAEIARGTGKASLRDALRCGRNCGGAGQRQEQLAGPAGRVRCAIAAGPTACAAQNPHHGRSEAGVTTDRGPGSTRAVCRRHPACGGALPRTHREPGRPVRAPRRRPGGQPPGPGRPSEPCRRRHLPGRLHQPRGLPPREAPLRAHGQALRLPGPTQPFAI
jgi:hypothetical protein